MHVRKIELFKENKMHGLTILHILQLYIIQILTALSAMVKATTPEAQPRENGKVVFNHSTSLKQSISGCVCLAYRGRPREAKRTHPLFDNTPNRLVYHLRTRIVRIRAFQIHRCTTDWVRGG